jgi:hypothetical protein
MIANQPLKLSKKIEQKLPKTLDDQIAKIVCFSIVQALNIFFSDETDIEITNLLEEIGLAPEFLKMRSIQLI